MELIQIFLPLRDNHGKSFPFQKFEQVKAHLAEKFGGVTAFINSPAEGVWQESPKNFIRDDIVTFEVMSEGVDGHWWQTYRKELEKSFSQEKILVRKMQVEIL